jgi:Pentapeptide repeats (8 copies)
VHKYETPCQARRSHTAILVNLCAAFFILVSSVLIAVPAPAQAQSTPSPNAAPETAREERQLNEARLSNEKAQADYYRAQAEKLQKPDPQKTFWRTLSDNAAILGALTAALVALFTLVVNQQTALRSRKDTEFYEALKRFGDKDSPTVRASAAAMLANMSDISFFALRWSNNAPWWRPDLNMIRYPYFGTVLDQLITGLLIEEHNVVVHGIVTGLKRVLPRDFKRSSDRLREANWRLQVELMTQLTDFFATKGLTKADEVKAEDWKEATILTRVPEEGLKAILDKFPDDFWNQSLLRNKADKIEGDAEKGPRTTDIHNRLTDVGRRLLQNIQLCAMLIEKRPKSATDPIAFDQMYLANISFSRGCNLRNTDFSNSLMPRAFLNEAKLGGAILNWTLLEPAFCSGLDLTDTNLWGVRIDRSKPPFDYSNWWQADYEARFAVDANHPTPIVSEDLIDTMLMRYGELSSTQLKDAHRSVKTYIAKRNTAQVEASAKTASPPNPNPSL